LQVSQDMLHAQAEELADLLTSRPEVTQYQEAERRMMSLPHVISMIRQLQDLQDQIGDFISRNVPEVHYSHLQQEMESILSRVEDIPEVVTFMDAQTQLNDLIQSVTGRLTSVLDNPTLQSD
jgi:cell fate (sporulation/competence/biofilm development) regulator YmcA (YheA/YmcA/DUF963 family)